MSAQHDHSCVSVFPIGNIIVCIPVYESLSYFSPFFSNPNTVTTYTIPPMPLYANVLLIIESFGFIFLMFLFTESAVSFLFDDANIKHLF